MAASVKVMLWHDYCHFEVSKSTDQPVTDAEIDEMRKDCMRLADKAIAQYKTAKSAYMIRNARKEEYEREVRACNLIEAKAEGDRSPNEMARLKTLKDRDWQKYIDEKYDYQDDWEDHRDDD